MRYDPAEFLARDDISRLQLSRLRTTCERAARSRLYARKFREHGVAPEDIKSLDDLRRLPFTTKQDLRESYPDGLNTVPADQMVRLHVSSGTTGTPTVVYHTASDVRWWSSLVARCMRMVGMTPADVFQNTTSYGLFTGGLGMHYGAELLGCMAIPMGAGNTQRQVKLIQDFKVTALHIIPSYALYLADYLARQGLDPRSLGLRIALVGAEPYSEETRRRLEDIFGFKAFNSYGLSEMNGPGVAFECREQNGMHLWEDAYLCEVIDPVTLEPARPGQVGELVLTTLCREGMPIVRYRTRDLTRVLPGPCPCGREHLRIDRITGRSDDLIIIKGVNIYPIQIEQVLMSLPEVGQNYLIELTREGHIDQIRVKAEVREEFFVEDMRALAALRERIAHRLRDEILVTPKVDLVEPNSLPKSEGKAVRVVDLRGKE
ncbi:Phenylacetate-coenzyme A ligase [Fundidesulfovibrio magnetotacticus]|uniref:Phenylacetate-coenzyme A ligase n=1 Tax=Fundidesulfovibrio magnetotacticus TaxID=2730080 RepID=A0A6V8LLC8_9BACT|nr:phenylacetate--CoA ligase [Fundidesulfovibrio magnetotacticus]GFK92504.1 Phenylacetate-coenzyme A ligase [Fundidesulfovibrio magnetotacticus]